MTFDIEIGGIGFYAISAITLAGRKWCGKVEGFRPDSGVAYCDDSRLVRNIADGARDAGRIGFHCPTRSGIGLA
jgi:hypothetical protein